MSTTPNLLISYVAASQNQKEVTMNAAVLALEEALTDFTSVALTDADYTFATGQGSLGLSNIVFMFTGTLTATRNVIFPPNAKLYIVQNGTLGGSPVTTESLIFKVGTGATTVTISDSLYHLLYCNGVNNVYHIGTLTGPVGFGTGTSGQAVTTTSPGSPVTGPANPTTIIAYEQVVRNGTIYWLPLFQ